MVAVLGAVAPQALQAPLISALAVLTNLLATAAAFGVAKLIFQDGHFSGLLDFEPQGFLNGWGPVLFFAMIFAIAKNYTVFLLSSAKEHYEHTGSPSMQLSARSPIPIASSSPPPRSWSPPSSRSPSPTRYRPRRWASCSASRSCSTPSSSGWPCCQSCSA